MIGDQPQYGKMKLLQLEEPDMFGEVYVILGGLHIFRGIGNLLHSSGWTSVLVHADIAPKVRQSPFHHALMYHGPVMLTR